VDFMKDVNSTLTRALGVSCELAVTGTSVTQIVNTFVPTLLDQARPIVVLLSIVVLHAAPPPPPTTAHAHICGDPHTGGSGRSLPAGVRASQPRPCCARYRRQGCNHEPRLLGGLGWRPRALLRAVADCNRNANRRVQARMRLAARGLGHHGQLPHVAAVDHPRA
jgi:hypothetical protein